MYEERVPDSVIRIELITHFHRNPGIEGTSSMLADLIGRDPAQVERQMIKLVQLRILEERRVRGERLYRYIPPFSISISSLKQDNKNKGKDNVAKEEKDAADMKSG